MIYSEGMMHKKIKWWVVTIIIFILVSIAAWFIAAETFAVISFGGRITDVKYASTCRDTRVCRVLCRPCGCGSWDNIVFIPFGGATYYVCPPDGFQYLQIPKPEVGMQIIGWGVDEYKPGQIGLSD